MMMGYLPVDEIDLASFSYILVSSTGFSSEQKTITELFSML
jgi:hypothetical protein